jgi:predicted transcriptional regulator
VSYAYTYREIGEADLAAYVKFLRGATGKRYQDAMNAAFMEAIAQASTQFGDFTSARPRRAAL